MASNISLFKLLKEDKEARMLTWIYVIMILLGLSSLFFAFTKK